MTASRNNCFILRSSSAGVRAASPCEDAIFQHSYVAAPKPSGYDWFASGTCVFVALAVIANHVQLTNLIQTRVMHAQFTQTCTSNEAVSHSYE